MTTTITNPEQVELTDEELDRLERESSARLNDFMYQDMIASLHGDITTREELTAKIVEEFKTGLQYTRMQIDAFKKKYGNEEKEGRSGLKLLDRKRS